MVKRRQSLRLTLLVATTFAIFILGLVATVWSASNTNDIGPVTVDEQVLRSSIPVQMTLGEEYVAKVLITNKENTPVTALVRLDVPLQFMVFEPSMIQTRLAGGESQILRFNITAHKENLGPLQINTIISVSDKNQIITEETITTSVRQISRPLFYTVLPVLILIVVGASAVIYILYKNRIRKAVKTHSRPRITST